MKKLRAEWMACRKGLDSVESFYESNLFLHAHTCECEDCIAIKHYYKLPIWKHWIAHLLWGAP